MSTSEEVAVPSTPVRSKRRRVAAARVPAPIPEPDSEPEAEAAPAELEATTAADSDFDDDALAAAAAAYDQSPVATPSPVPVAAAAAAATSSQRKGTNKKRKTAPTPDPPSESESSSESSSDSDSDDSDKEKDDGPEEATSQDLGSQAGKSNKKSDAAAVAPPSRIKMALSNPQGATAAIHHEVPAETQFINPNNTLLHYSLRHRLYMHFAELDYDQFMVRPPKAKLENNERNFLNVQYSSPQRFDFTGGSNFQRIPFPNKAMVIGPFGANSFPRLWPLGDKERLPNSQYPPPKTAGDIKFRLKINTRSYYEEGSVLKQGVGLVNNDTQCFMDVFMPGVVGRLCEEFYRYGSTFFPVVSKAAAEAVAPEWKRIEDKAKDIDEQIAKAMKKGKTSKVAQLMKDKPTLTEDAKKKDLLKEFERGLKKPVSTDGEGFTQVSFSTPLFMMPNKNQQKDPTFLPPGINDHDLFQYMWNTPPPYEDKTGQIKAGFKRYPRDLPLYRCVTLEEAMEDKAKRRSQLSPIRLVPRQERFAESTDILAPIFSFDGYDTTGTAGSGIRFELAGVLWLGEANRLPMRAEPKRSTFNPRLPDAYYSSEGLDPTTYFLSAQKYTRTKDYQHGSVESRAAASEQQQMCD